MSVIAWDGNTFAADRLGLSGDLRTVTKKTMYASSTHRFPNGVVVAWTGQHESGLILADWYLTGEREEKWPSFQDRDDWSRLVGLGIDASGRKHLFVYERKCVCQPEDPNAKMAWGAGRDFAMGAMSAGADAVQAVKITERHCVCVGFGVEAYRTEKGHLEYEVIP